MNCIIIEDQLPAQRILIKYINDLEYLKLVGTYTDALEGIEALKSLSIDLIFLDIHLPKLSGIEFIKTLSHPPQIILTTAFSEYALEGYDLNVVDYLLKPFSFHRFVKAVSKVNNTSSVMNLEPNWSENRVKKDIFFKSGYEHIKLNEEQILYIKSDIEYTEIHLDQKKHLSVESLKYWEATLSPIAFLRVHKSYIINTSKITKFSGNRIYLQEDKVIPLGRAYKNEFTKRFLL